MTRAIVCLDPATADRLAKLCGMFGSHHDGERAAAAVLADKLVRAVGLTWFDVISPPAKAEPQPKPAPVWDDPVRSKKPSESQSATGRR